MPKERGQQRSARSPLAPQIGRLDVELDAEFNLIERLLISMGSTCALKRPENKQIHDPETGDWSKEWKAYFARLRFCVGELNIAPGGFVIGPPAAQIIMAGLAPSITPDQLIAAPSGAMEIAGLAPVLQVDQLIAAPAGAMEIAGHVPIVEAVAPATVAFTDSDESDANASTYDTAISPVALGTGTTADKFIVLVCGRLAASGTLDDVTIDGNAATIVAGASTVVDDANNLIAAIAIADATANSSGDISVTFSSNSARVGVGVYRVSNLLSTTPTDTGQDQGDAPSASINISAGGVAFGVCCANDSTIAWTNLTENYQADMEAGRNHTGASAAFASAQVGLALSNDATSEVALAVASFR
jgi:hypothetical protein